MRKFLRNLALFGATLFASYAAQAQNTVTVTADLKTMFGAAQGTKTQVCFSLTDGNGNQLSDPRVLGVGVIVPTATQCVLPDVTGHISTSMYANDRIDPVNSIYTVTYTYNGRAVHGDIFQFLAADGTENLNTKTPLNTTPVVAAPTGDTTYARLDGGNMPFTGPVSTTTGYRISGTAPSGHVLRGNGTNYVDAILAFTDLSGILGTTQGGTGQNSSATFPTSGTVDTGTGTSNTIPKFTGSSTIGNSGITDDGTTVNVPTEKLNAPGNLTQGTVALKYTSGDHTIYLSKSGSDSNDGLSPGSAKLTPQAAFDTATGSGANTGSVIVSPGSYTCPTTWYSGLTVMATNLGYPANVAGSFSVTNGPLYSGVTFSCTSGSDHTIDTVNNLTLIGIFFDFNNSGGGLILKAVQASKFYSWGVNLAGNATHPAIKMIPGSSAPANNNAFNAFYDTKIVTPNATVSADCLKLIGTGTPNAGPAVTDNEFHGIVCTGRIQNGIDFELNTDTNKIWGFEANNLTSATGDVIVFNKDTTGSDQDADNEIVMGACFTGSFSHPVSAGASFGNTIQVCSGGGPVTMNVLGGTPRYNLETTGLFGVVPEHAVANLQVNAGMRAGTGFKHQRFGGTCTTAAAAGATCTTNFTWTAAFPDNNYTFACMGGAAGSGVPVIDSAIKSGTAGTQITVQVVALTAAAATFNAVECIAVHDPI